MPVQANVYETKKYNNWLIKSILIDNFEKKIVVKYGRAANVGTSYEFEKLITLEITGDDFDDLSNGNADANKNMKFNIKNNIYKHLIKKGLIDNNEVI